MVALLILNVLCVLICLAELAIGDRRLLGIPIPVGVWVGLLAINLVGGVYQGQKLVHRNNISHMYERMTETVLAIDAERAERGEEPMFPDWKTPEQIEAEVAALSDARKEARRIRWKAQQKELTIMRIAEERKAFEAKHGRVISQVKNGNITITTIDKTMVPQPDRPKSMIEKLMLLNGTMTEDEVILILGTPSGGNKYYESDTEPWSTLRYEDDNTVVFFKSGRFTRWKFHEHLEGIAK